MIGRMMLLAAVAAELLSADSLRLRDGSSVTGNWFGADEQTIRFVVNNQVQTFAKTDILQVIFGNAATETMPPVTPAKTIAPPGESFEKTEQGLYIKINKCEKQGAVAVACSFTLESVNSDQQLWLWAFGNGVHSFMVDANGMQQDGVACKLGSASGSQANTLLVKGTPVRGELQFKGVGASVNRLAMLTIGGYKERGEWKFVFRNVPLQ